MWLGMEESFVAGSFDFIIRGIDLDPDKDISNNNPGCPPNEYILKWAEKFDLYEHLLEVIFGELENDYEFRPQVEPTDFQKYIPVLKSVEKE